jgi:hypothetical protein
VFAPAATFAVTPAEEMAGFVPRAGFGVGVAVMMMFMFVFHVFSDTSVIQRNDIS